MRVRFMKPWSSHGVGAIADIPANLARAIAGEDIATILDTVETPEVQAAALAAKAPASSAGRRKKRRSK